MARDMKLLTFNGFARALARAVRDGAASRATVERFLGLLDDATVDRACEADERRPTMTCGAQAQLSRDAATLEDAHELLFEALRKVGKKR